MLYLFVYLLFPLLLAVFLLTWGYYLLKRRRIRMSARQKLLLQKQLSSWQINEPASSQTIQDVYKHLDTLKAFMSLGMGTSMTLAAIIMAWVNTLTTGIPPIDILFGPFMVMIPCLVPPGCWLGEIIGLRKLKRESTRRFTFGDLRQRLAADYRSPLWLIAPLLLGIANIVIALISIFDLHSPMRILLIHNTVVWIPTWLLLILPAMMLLLVIGIEMNIRYIARFPRLQVITPPALAQRLDDMLRSIMIGTTIGAGCYLIAYLHIAQDLFLIRSLSGSASFTVSILLLLNPLVGMPFILIVSHIQTLHGHLGGNVSGWPRRGAKGEVSGTAAADR